MHKHLAWKKVTNLKRQKNWLRWSGGRWRRPTTASWAGRNPSNQKRNDPVRELQPGAQGIQRAGLVEGPRGSLANPVQGGEEGLDGASLVSKERECLVLVQTSSPHDCLPPPASHHHHCNHHYDQVAISSQRREPRLHQRKLRSFFGAKMMLLHSGEKPFVCNQCGYSTIKDDHLKMHKMVQSGVKPFACKQCIYSC